MIRSYLYLSTMSVTGRLKNVTSFGVTTNLVKNVPKMGRVVDLTT